MQNHTAGPAVILGDGASGFDWVVKRVVGGRQKLTVGAGCGLAGAPGDGGLGVGAHG